MSMNLSRRQFLKLSAGLAVGPILVGACGPATPATSGTAAGRFGKLTHQLSWVMNIQFAGSLVAHSKGYYVDEGFESAEILPGGPETAPVAIVTSGKALTGFVSFAGAANARASGAKIKIIGAKYQRNPSGITSLASNPIRTPADLIGKKVGVSAASVPTWQAFLAANGISDSEVTTVPVQFDPQPLVNGEVDGWYSFIISQPNVLRSRGVEVEVMAFHDFGYATPAEAYFTTEENIAGSRDAVKAFLAGDIRGWRDVITNPEEAVNLVVENYGKDLGLDPAEQLLEAQDQNSLLILTAEARKNGLAYLTPEQQEQATSVLKLTGVEASPAELFDLSLLDELYADRPDLRAGL